LDGFESRSRTKSVSILRKPIGTIDGALGAPLETDEAVREAAYAHRPTKARGR
jgi:hypothetical protein